MSMSSTTTKSENGYMRGCFMFDTYKGKFFLNEKNKIIGLKSKNINNGKLFGEETINEVTLGIGNVVKSILEKKEYQSFQDFLIELNNSYSYKLTKTLEKKDNKLKKAA